ncbi:MAG: hypothetical protein NVSMB19_07470 [Vulcanimicrobiaceae bacterium]
MRRETLALGLVLTTATGAGAQATIVPATLGTFVRYGLDTVRLRVVRVQRVPHVDGRPYVRGFEPRGDASAYLLVTLEARNDGTRPENLPLLQVTLATAGGATIDPAVYGPFIGDATVEAPASTTIAPHRTVVMRLAVADVPNDRPIAELVLSPNDTTPAYRYRLRARDVTPLAPLPAS